MPQNMLSLDTELRKLRPAEFYTLGQILSVSDSWKKLMAIIPRDGTADLPKFNSEHFSLIEQAVQQQKRSAAEIFLQEWATMGKNRPTIGALLDFLVKAELFRAADYIAADLLKGETPKRPEYGPAAVVDISEETIQKLIENNMLGDTDSTAECLPFGSSAELDMVKQVYLPEATVNAVPNSYLERNTQSTKLAAETDSRCIKNNLMTDNTRSKKSAKVPNEMSDLLKFESVDGNIITPAEHKNNNAAAESRRVASYAYDMHELTSRELPIILNDFAEYKSANQLKVNEELQSAELPLFLNNRVSDVSDEVSQTQSESRSNSSFIKNELSSTDLPQMLTCRSGEPPINRVSYNENKNENFNLQNMTSQELPITVLEYQRV